MTDEEKAAAEAAAKAEAEKKAAEEAAAAEKSAKEKEAAEKAAADAKKTEAEKAAQAAAEAAEARAKELEEKLAAAESEAKKYEGIDPEKAKAAMTAAEQAEKARIEAEKERAKAEGDFEKLREIQQKEVDAQVTAANERAEKAEAAAKAANEKLDAVTLESAFGNSTFLSDETVLSGANAKRLYGDYVDIEDGKAIVYDKPRGAEKRGKVMDTKGNALSFDEAIKQVVNSDPDKDSFLKSKTKPGASSSSEEGKPKAPTQTRQERIAAGLRKLKG